jgi:hypothetical protein
MFHVIPKNCGNVFWYMYIHFNTTIEHYDFLIKTMFGSSLSPVLFRLCQYVLCFSLDCPFFIAASVFSNVYYYYLYMYSCLPLVGPKLAIKYSHYTCTGTCCKPAHIIIWLEKNLVLLLDYQTHCQRLNWFDLFSQIVIFSQSKKYERNVQDILVPILTCLHVYHSLGYIDIISIKQNNIRHYYMY